MSLAGSFVDDSAFTTDVYCRTAVTLNGYHELEPAVAVRMIVPVPQRHHALACLIVVNKWLAVVIRPILHRPEQRLRAGVVVGYPWIGEGYEYSRIIQAALHVATRMHCRYRLKNQRLLAPFTDWLSDASHAHQIGCDGWILTLWNIPGH
jgi:hypothetical protein